MEISSFTYRFLRRTISDAQLFKYQHNKRNIGQLLYSTLCFFIDRSNIISLCSYGRNELSWIGSSTKHQTRQCRWRPFFREPPAFCLVDASKRYSFIYEYHIRQGVAEDPGLMHRVKKVAFRTRLQSGLSLRVYNHHFFTRNNSLLDLNWQCHAPKLMNVNQECHLLFCHSFLPLARHWCLVLVGTPEARLLYQRHLLVHLVHPSQPKSGKYTEARLLYQWCAPVYSMHNKSLLTYIFCPTEQSETVLPGMKSYAHLKHHSFDK